MAKQIIAPGVYSELVDKSEFSPAGIQPQIAALQPIFSKRGEDGKIKLKENTLKASQEYGLPSYSTFRDFNYMAAMNWLKGGLPAQLCRLTASDATKASVFLGIKANADRVAESNTVSDTVYYETGKAYPVGSIRQSNGDWYVSIAEIFALEEKYINSTGKWSQFYSYSKTATYSIGDLVFVDKGLYIEIFKAAVASSTPAGTFSEGNWTSQLKLYSADHYVKMVLHDGSDASVLNIGKFEAIGSGADYNGVFLRFAYNNSLANDIDKAAYKFEVYDYNEVGEEVVITGEENDFSFAEIKDLDDNSLFIEDTIAEVSKTVKYIDLLTDINTAEEDIIQNEIMTLLKGRHISSIETDFKQIFLTNIIAEILNKKIILNNGSDGSLFVNGKIDTAVRDQLLIDFYSGLVDERILSFMEIPASFTFDMQGTNISISGEISNFTKNSRTDIFSYHSGKKCINAEDFYDYRIKEFNFDNRNASLRGGWFKIRDIYEQRIIEVPVFLTKITDLARSVRENGVAIVHAGYGEEGVVTGYVPDTLVFSPSLYYQDKFYMKQINSPVKDPDGIYYLSSRTLQRRNSKLSMEFAVQADQRIMTDTLIIGRRFINKFITDEVLQDIKNAYREYFDNNWLTSPAVSSVEVVVEASAYDRKNNTARAYFIITFNNILEKLVLVRTIK